MLPLKYLILLAKLDCKTAYLQTRSVQLLFRFYHQRQFSPIARRKKDRFSRANILAQIFGSSVDARSHQLLKNSAIGHQLCEVLMQFEYLFIYLLG
jgi:hypothetical protein